MTVQILSASFTVMDMVMVMLVVGIFVSFIRFIKGPSLPDRVVALDLIAMLAVGIIAVYAIATDQPVLLDSAIVLAIIVFLGTVAFARYVEKERLR